MDISQIKYRGQREKDGKWIYGNLFVTNEYLSCAKVYIGKIDPENAVKPETVGNWTSFFDKSSTPKEIYEGDILKVYFLSQSKIYGVVTWLDGRYVVDDTFGANLTNDKPDIHRLLSNNVYRYEVCDNIYTDSGKIVVEQMAKK